MSGDVISGDRRLSKEELLERAGRAAGALAGIGVRPGGRVAMLLRNDIPFLEATIASTIAGAIAVPINWHFTAEEIAYVLQDCEAAALIVHCDLWRSCGQGLKVLGISIPVVLATTPPHIADAYRIEGNDTRPRADEHCWEDFCSQGAAPARSDPAPTIPVIYTSGTTGRPKGVIRRAPVTAAGAYYDRFFDAAGKLLLSAPLYHSAPNRFGMLCYQAGGTLVLQTRFDAEDTLRLIERYRITDSFMVPTMFNRLLRLPEAVKERYDLGSLRRVVTAGAPCPPEIKAAMIAWWGPVIYEYYGSTEVGLLSYSTSQEARNKPGTVGKPVGTANIRILDDANELCPPGVAGEIFARRTDYPDFDFLNRHDERLALDHEGLIATGDVGYLDDDGYLFISDRKRDMVISGGVNIYPAQIEAALLGYEGVADCAAFGIPDPDLGEVVVAVFEASAGATVDADGIRAYLRGRIASYMVPREFIWVEAMPRDESGKIAKRKLRDAHAAGQLGGG